MERLLSDQRTTFVVVSTLEAAPSHEAVHLARELRRRDYPLGAVVANRVLPTAYTGRSAARSARSLAEAADGPVAIEVGERLGVAEDDVRAVLAEVGARFDELALVATREAERLAEFDDLAPLVTSAVVFDRDLNDVSDLLALSDQLRGEAP